MSAARLPIPPRGHYIEASIWSLIMWSRLNDNLPDLIGIAIIAFLFYCVAQVL